MARRYNQIDIDGKYVLEHRYVMEQYLGRKLLLNEYVHHINGDTFDNRIENLMVVTPEEHGILHSKYPRKKKSRTLRRQSLTSKLPLPREKPIRLRLRQMRR